MYKSHTHLPRDPFPKLPALPEQDADYTYKPISQEEADHQGPFIEVIDGEYVPASGKPVSELMTKREEFTMPASPKRKAEDQPDDQPPPKTAAIAKNEEAVPKAAARHPAGLLAAVEALEERTSETPPSNAPSPRPEPLDAPSPGNADPARASGISTPRDPLEIPVPRGATSPDDQGVRLINRKPTQMNVPNNRIMVPMPFYFEDHEIGFRDSTNSLQKGATKARRGRYLDKPNSNFMFIDRRVGTWDSTNPDDEFDDVLVKKHRLHPTLGIILPTSVNDWEPPKPVVAGWNPVVLVAPDGRKIHASRTIADARLDQELQRAEDKARFRVDLRKFCESGGISEKDVAPGQDHLREYRRKMLIARGMDPYHEISIPPTPIDTVKQEPDESSAVDSLEGFNEFVEEALRAAERIDAEDGPERVAASSSPPPPQSSQSSRPYDAIRDVFTDTSNSYQNIQPGDSASAPEPPLIPADTTNLSCLADAAEQLHLSAQSGTMITQWPASIPISIPASEEDNSAIDPLLFGQGGIGGNAGRPGPLDRAENIRAAEYPLPEGPPPAPPVTAGFVPQNDGGVLLTSLSQPQRYQPPVGPPFQDYPTPSAGGPPIQEYPPPSVGGPQIQDYNSGIPPTESPSPAAPGAAPGRTPFSSAGNAVNGKGLPALRPVRGLSDGSPPPETQESPVLQHPNMVSSNSGAFYPPNPIRPFHTSFSVQEYIPTQPVPPPPVVPAQPPMVAPIAGNTQGPIPGPIIPGPVQGNVSSHIPGPPPLAGPSPGTPQLGPYRSPPNYHMIPTPIAPAPIAPAPPLLSGPAAPMLMAGPATSSSPAPPTLGLAAAPYPPAAGLPPQLSNSAPNAAALQGLPATPSPRSRPGSSSAAAASSSAAATGPGAGKYRKLEPAPTPPHRMGYAGNGQELRTVQFDYREQIKDYSAKEAPPRHGPTHIRGWTHNNQSNIKKSSSSASSSRPTSKGDNNAGAGSGTGGGEEPS